MKPVYVKTGDKKKYQRVDKSKKFELNWPLFAASGANRPLLAAS